MNSCLTKSLAKYFRMKRCYRRSSKIFKFSMCANPSFVSRAYSFRVLALAELLLLNGIHYGVFNLAQTALWLSEQFYTSTGI